MIAPHIELGRINTLRLDRFTAPGCYLMAEDEHDVLLPNQYVTDEMQLDDALDVFIYTDSEDRLVATTQKPLALRDEFGFFEVVDVTAIGAFVDWGLPKDLFVPKNLQKNPMKVGEKRFLRIIKDPRSDRLIGIEKISKYLEKPTQLRTNEKIDLLLIAKTPLGYKVIVQNRFEGMLYSSEIFEPVNIGDTKTGYVKQLRKDGLLDCALQPVGKKRVENDADKLLSILDASKGILPYNYKSDPDTIMRVFNMSRKAFKRTLTQLSDAGVIEVRENGIFKK